MSVEVDVALHQGKYYRPDTKSYMSDYEYHEWLRKNKVERPMENGGAIARIAKARKELACAACPYLIHPGMHYYYIQFGKGLGAMLFPDRLHLECWREYWAKRAEER